MSSRRLFWILPLAAALLGAATMWERAQRQQRRGVRRPGVIGGMQLVGPSLQFELYDSENRTVRLVRYLGRHRIDLVFLAAGVALDADPVVVALRKQAASEPGGRILLIISPELPQVIRRQQSGSDGNTLVVLSDAGGRRDQLPGGVARAWGVLGHGDQVAGTSWFVIDRAGRVAWSESGPLARDVDDVQAGGPATTGQEN